MSQEKQLTLTILILATLSPFVLQQPPPKFMDTLPSFSDPNGNDLFNVVVDHKSGDVFVGGHNVLYHLSAELKLKRTVKTGPVEDDQDCPIPPDLCKEGDFPTDNKNRLLKMVGFMGSPPKLLLCGTAYRRLCQVRPVDNLDEVHWVQPYNSSLRYDLGETRNRALFTRGHGDQWTLFTAHGREDTEDYTDVPAVSVKTFAMEGDDYYFHYPLRQEPTSSYFFVNATNEKRVVGEGFVHEGYIYFLVTNIFPFDYDRRVEETSATKLLRLCLRGGAATQSSYAELQLQCDLPGVYRRDSPGMMNEAFALHYGDAAEGGGKSLYVSFALTTFAEEFLRYYEGTAICIFPMSDVVAAFDSGRAESSCDRQYFGSVCDDQAINSTCGSFCPPYVVNQALLVNGSFYFRKIRLQSIITVNDSREIVLIGGGDGGSIIKVNVSTGRIISQNFMSDKVKQHYYGRGWRDMFGGPFALDRDREHIYALVQDKIVKYPLSSCSAYETCHKCLTAGHNDPAVCGWGGGHCVRQDSCAKDLFSRENCTPLIYNVTPLYGTIQGGEMIIIQGDNFGTVIDIEQTSLLIAGTPCKVSNWNNTKVICTLGSAPEATVGPIQINIIYNPLVNTSTEHHYTIKGTAEGFQNFTYFTGPRIYGIRPSTGPTSGGTNVTIYGENLDYDINKTRTFIVSTRECALVRFDKDTATCVTEGPSDSEEFSESLAVYLNKITYNVMTPPSTFDFTGLSDSFEYSPDPEIHLMQPGVTTMSGLKNVTATGIYLDTVQHPRLELEINGLSELVIESCWSDPASRGTLLTCRTPSLLDRPDLETHPTWDQPLVTYVSFVMDDVWELRVFREYYEDLARLLYVPDPVFQNFSRDGDTLYINGSHFDIIKSSDNFKINLGEDYVCTLKTVSEEGITCSIPDLAEKHSVSGANLSVEVSIGYSRRHLGYLMIDVQKDVHVHVQVILNPVWWILPLIALVLTIIILFGCFKLWRKRSLGTINAITLDNMDHGVNEVILNYASLDLEDAPETNQVVDLQIVDSETLKLLEDKNLIILKSHLVFGEIVGAGQFGSVFVGFLLRPEETEPTKVAIKTLREHSWSNVRTVESFLKEALIMKDFDHPNVLHLIGVCMEGVGPSIVLPFMENGDVCSYIRDETRILLVQNLLKFAVDIASGMAYLAEKKFLHRDLAARNCILDSSLLVRVADFGLSRDVYVDDYYRCEDRSARLPYRWMAPESLEDQKYSPQSDVWSYGVLLWELMTRGVLPYAHIGNWEVLEYIKSGHRLDQPEHCPKSLYMIMLACWNMDPKMRPEFSLIRDCMNRLLQKLLCKPVQKIEDKAEYVPAQNTVYYNSKELYLQMDGHCLDETVVEQFRPAGYLGMKKETSL